MKNISLALFKNDHKKEEKHPDYEVSMKVGDKFEKVGAGWKKMSAKGTNFISISLQAVPIWNMLQAEQSTPEAAAERIIEDIL